MYTQLQLDHTQLLEIASNLQEKIMQGLQAPNQEIPCFPTYIHTGKTAPTGRALVMDFGGTNVRAAVVSLKEGNGLIIEQGPVKRGIHMTRGVALERNDFLSGLSEIIASLNPPDDLPLGYCFSYPADSTPDGDARLIKWTKELFVKDTVNEKVGQILLDHLAEYTQPVRCSKATVINDTVASMLAGLTAADADGHIGLIVGTGNNMAALIDSSLIPKLPSELNWQGELPVNLESCNFNPPFLTDWDDALDAQSENPGHHRFEKAVSGVYLASLLKLVYPESTIDTAIGSKAVVDIAYNNASSDEQEVAAARQILERSAKMVAASLAGLIAVMNSSRQVKHVCIAAEGGLFWGCPSYEPTTRATLESLLKAMNIPTAVTISSFENANLVGSAVAALSETASA